jgi:hypothetical protein
MARAILREIESKRFERVWLAACVGGFLLLCWVLRRFVTDDAWITARYAENLANGHGFVWNPGGPRAEGFSNPLLVYAEALSHALGLSAIGAARAIGVICGVALLLVIHRLGPDVVGRSATRVALAVTALYPPIALWAVGGLETIPTALAATAGALLLARPHHDMRDSVRAGLVLAVLPWLRPEGIVLALALAAAAEAPALLRAAERRTALLRLRASAGIPLASLALLEALRLIVYGHLMPNSVIYKSASGSGSLVLEKFTEQAPALLVIAVLGVLLARGRQLVLAVPPVVYAFGSIGTLDSVNSFSRFFMPTWPHCALFVGIAVAAATQRFGRLRSSAALAAAVALVALIVVAQEARIDETKRWGENYAACKDGARENAAAWLRGHTRENSKFAISDAGLTPAQAGGRVAIDQFLLNEPMIQDTGPLPIARRVNLVFARDPDVLVVTSRTTSAYTPLYETDRQVTRDARFRRYKLAHVARGEGDDCGYHLFLFLKRDAPLDPRPS